MATLTASLRELLPDACRACAAGADARVVGERVKVRNVELLDGPAPTLIAEVVRRGVTHRIAFADLEAEDGSALALLVARCRELCGWSELTPVAPVAPPGAPAAEPGAAMELNPSDNQGARFLLEKSEAGMSWEQREAAGRAEGERARSPYDEPSGGTRRMPVDLAALAEALDDGSPGHAWYLDLESGDLVPVFDDFGDELLPVPREELEDSARFIHVEPRPGHEGWRDMTDFVATVEDGVLRHRLADAIEGKGAFGRFRRVLDSSSAERERWFEWKGARLAEEARAWLSRQGIEAVPGTEG